MPESALAGLPRLVRIAPELRFRGQAAGGIAVATAGYWAFAVALPTLAVSGLPSGERVREALRRTLPPPRAALHETPADGRERRTRLAGIVVTGVMVLLMFDVLTDGGGVMAGLIAGLFGALGTVDWIDARRWERAERVREARLFLLVRPHALSARFGAAQVYELSRPRRPEPLGSGVGPFDLGL
jgi:hypothetical protein